MRRNAAMRQNATVGDVRTPCARALTTDVHLFTVNALFGALPGINFPLDVHVHVSGKEGRFGVECTTLGPLAAYSPTLTMSVPRSICTANYTVLDL